MEQASTASWRLPIAVFAAILAAAALWVTISAARGSSSNSPGSNAPAQTGGPSSFFGVADGQGRGSGDENCPDKGKRGGSRSSDISSEV